MDDSLWMQIPNAQAQVDKYFPNDILSEMFVQLLMLDDQWVEISIRAILNDDIDLLVIYEWVNISHDEWRI